MHFCKRISGVISCLFFWLCLAQTWMPQQAKAQAIADTWTDPHNGLMWATRDNGKDIGWRGAAKYCRNLRLVGQSDWRLPNISALAFLYDPHIDTLGLSGAGRQETFTWHVRGKIFLTGEPWTSDYKRDDRGKFSGYAYYFNFNDGHSNDDPTGWLYPHQGRRALCVRGEGISPPNSLVLSDPK